MKWGFSSKINVICIYMKALENYFDIPMNVFARCLYLNMFLAETKAIRRRNINHNGFLYEMVVQCSLYEDIHITLQINK